MPTRVRGGWRGGGGENRLTKLLRSGLIQENKETLYHKKEIIYSNCAVVHWTCVMIIMIQGETKHIPVGSQSAHRRRKNTPKK